jgi:hypothetical protein
MDSKDHDILIAIKTSVEFIEDNMVTHDQCATHRAKNGLARTTKTLDVVHARLWAAVLIILSVGMSAAVAKILR